MLDENFVQISELNAEILEDGNLNINKSELENLYRKGFRNLKLILMGNPNEAVEFLDIDSELFKQIKKTQNLPDAVIVDFLEAKGKVSKDNFK